MRSLRFFYLILAFWLSFTGVTAGKPVSAFKKSMHEYIVKPSLTGLRIVPLKYKRDLSFYKLKKDTKLKSFRKTGIKKRATQLETTVLPKTYQSEFVLIEQWGDSPNYGLTAIYHISLHTYLHLYQLF